MFGDKCHLAVFPAGACIYHLQAQFGRGQGCAYGNSCQNEHISVAEYQKDYSESSAEVTGTSPVLAATSDPPLRASGKTPTKHLPSKLPYQPVMPAHKQAASQKIPITSAQGLSTSPPLSRSYEPKTIFGTPPRDASVDSNPTTPRTTTPIMSPTSSTATTTTTAVTVPTAAAYKTSVPLSMTPANINIGTNLMGSITMNTTKQIPYTTMIVPTTSHTITPEIPFSSSSGSYQAEMQALNREFGQACINVVNENEIQVLLSLEFNCGIFTNLFSTLLFLQHIHAKFLK